MIWMCGLVAKFLTCPSFPESYAKNSNGVLAYNARKCSSIIASDLWTPSLIATDGTTTTNFVNL